MSSARSTLTTTCHAQFVEPRTVDRKTMSDRGLDLLDVIGEAEDELLALRGYTVISPTMCCDASGSGLPIARWRALDVARREVIAARAELIGGML
jgi:hypothetical protein